MQENNRNSKGTGEPSARRLAMDSLSGIVGGRYGSLSVDAVLRRSALEGADRGLYAALVFGVLERQTTLIFWRNSCPPARRSSWICRCCWRCGWGCTS